MQKKCHNIDIVIVTLLWFFFANLSYQDLKNEVYLFIDSPVLPILQISRNPWKAIFHHFYEYLPLETILVWALMALPVMEFQDQVYKIRKIFAEKSTYPKEIIEFW